MITLIAIAGIVLTTSVFGLFLLVKSEAADIRDELEKARAEIDYLKRKNKIIERRFQKMSEPSDKIEIIHRYDDEDAPRFGGF